MWSFQTGGHSRLAVGSQDKFRSYMDTSHVSDVTPYLLPSAEPQKDTQTSSNPNSLRIIIF